jgi:O-methyltransferase
MFADTLTHELVRKYNISKASLIMIDCDLYEGAKQALDFCAPLILDEAIVFLDDWSGGGIGLDGRKSGEPLAFDEFLAENTSLRAEEFSSYWHREHSPPGLSKVFLVSRNSLK